MRRAAAHLLSATWNGSRPPLTPERGPRGPSPEQIRRRRVAALGCDRRRRRRGRRRGRRGAPAPPPQEGRRRLVPPPPKPFRVIFPEGFTRKQMAERVTAVAKIARAQAPQAGGAQRQAVPPRAPARRAPVLHAAPQTKVEGFLFPATYDFLATTTSRQLVDPAVAGVLRQLAQGRPLLRAEEEPDAVRRADHRARWSRRRRWRPSERPARRGGHLQPPARAHAARDRRDAALRAQHRADAVDPAVAARQRQPVQLAQAPGAAADADREPGARRRSGPRRTRRKVDYLYFVRKPDKVHHFFTASDTAFAQYECAHGYGC